MSYRSFYVFAMCLLCMIPLSSLAGFPGVRIFESGCESTVLHNGVETPIDRDGNGVDLLLSACDEPEDVFKVKILLDTNKPAAPSNDKRFLPTFFDERTPQDFLIANLSVFQEEQNDDGVDKKLWKWAPPNYEWFVDCDGTAIQTRMNVFNSFFKYKLLQSDYEADLADGGASQWCSRFELAAGNMTYRDDGDDYLAGNGQIIDNIVEDSPYFYFDHSNLTGGHFLTIDIDTSNHFPADADDHSGREHIIFELKSTGDKACLYASLSPDFSKKHLGAGVDSPEWLVLSNFPQTLDDIVEVDETDPNAFAKHCVTMPFADHSGYKLKYHDSLGDILSNACKEFQVIRRADNGAILKNQPQYYYEEYWLEDEHYKERSRSASAVVIQCIVETMENLFSHEGVPGGAVIEENGEQVIYHSFFSRLQSKLVDFVAVVMTLALIIWGYRLFLNHKVPQSDAMWFMVKLSLVWFFATGIGVALLYGPTIDAMSGLSALFLQADAETYPYCIFKPENYENDFQYLRIWDMIDCKFMHFLGVGYNPLNPNEPVLLAMVTATFLIAFAGYSLPLFILALVTMIFLFLLIVRIVFTYIIAMTGVAILAFLLPLVAPTVLFEKTKYIFTSWWNQFLAFILQLIFLFAFLSMALAAFDHYVYGPPPSGQKYTNSEGNQAMPFCYEPRGALWKVMLSGQDCDTTDEEGRCICPAFPYCDYFEELPWADAESDAEEGWDRFLFFLGGGLEKERQVNWTAESCVDCTSDTSEFCVGKGESDCVCPEQNVEPDCISGTENSLSCVYQKFTITTNSNLMSELFAVDIFKGIDAEFLNSNTSSKEILFTFVKIILLCYLVQLMLGVLETLSSHIAGGFKGAGIAALNPVETKTPLEIGNRLEDFGKDTLALPGKAMKKIRSAPSLGGRDSSPTGKSGKTKTPKERMAEQDEEPSNNE